MTAGSMKWKRHSASTPTPIGLTIVSVWHCYTPVDRARVYRTLKSAIRLNPRSPILWAYYDMLGRCFFNLRNYEEAAACFKKATKQPSASFFAIHPFGSHARPSGPNR